MSVSKDLIGLLKENDRKGTQGYDTQAEVLRVEGDTVWVKIPGGVPETPVQKTINAVEGDTVQVRVAGGNAWLVGNASAPPTDDATALMALESASIAKTAADNAEQSAATAEQAAQEATATAESVRGIAEQAQEAATEAEAKAAQAETAAATADSKATAASTAAAAAQTSADNAAAAASAADTKATNAASAAAAAQSSADSAATAAGNAQSAAQQATQDAATAGRAAAVAQAAAEAAQGDIDDLQEWFWHDANGSHVLGATSGYRNDITSSGMNIVETATETSVAEFGANGARVGKETSAHLLLEQTGIKGNNDEGYTVLDINTRAVPITQRWQQDNSSSTTICEISLKHIPTEHVEIRSIFVRDSLGSYYINQGASAIPLDGSTVITYKTIDGKTVNVESQYDSRTRIVKIELKNPKDLPGALELIDFRIQYTTNYYNPAIVIGEGEALASFAISLNKGKARTQYSVAENMATSYGEYSHAEGEAFTGANAAYSHAEGAAITNGNYSHAEGQAVANGNYSHAEGTRINGSIVFDVAAEGFASHVEGYATNAGGFAAHAQNYRTIADGKSQTVIGEFNVVDAGATATDKGVNAFIVGNGTDDNNRSNAFTVAWNGDTVAAGDITDGSGNVLADKVDTSALATVATTGAYSDLIGAPTIPTKTSDLTNDSDFKSITFPYTGGSPENEVTSLATSTWTVVGNITLDKGTHLLTVKARTQSNATGRRTMLLSSNNNADGTGALSVMASDHRAAVNGDYTDLLINLIVSAPADNTKQYIKIMQNSGSTLTCNTRVSDVLFG